MDYRERRDLPPALLNAQQKLTRIRRQYQAQGRLWSRAPVGDVCKKPESSNCKLNRSQLGWGSVPLTKALRKARGDEVTSPRNKIRDSILAQLATSARNHQGQSGEKAASPGCGSKEDELKIYPDIALGMLGKKFVAAGRIWLLLQHYDHSGRGWLPLATTRELLTDKNSALRLCGRRQLRKLLVQGEDVFWKRDSNRIWLKSVAKVAVALGVVRLRGRPVSLPVAVLLEGIGSVRAHFFASFHSGRQTKGSTKRCVRNLNPDPDPLSRATLQQLTHVQPRTQRHYEVRASVKRRRNFALIQQSGTEAIQNQAWLRGRAWFRYTDFRGEYGSKGRAYSAWQLPNSYWGPHETSPTGRQKKINKEIVDLFMKGMTGNGNFLAGDSETPHDFPARRFFKTGSAAASRYNRGSDYDIYWRSDHGSSGKQAVWHCLPGRS